MDRLAPDIPMDDLGAHGRAQALTRTAAWQSSPRDSGQDGRKRFQEGTAGQEAQQSQRTGSVPDTDREEHRAHGRAQATHSMASPGR
ncbi:hypothetical protein TW86_04610 [Halomonas sp. S2151]|uniref:Uncharacterized protein n=1 Tax=Halomonas litopenaei TaxID=2109328 RepID=A0ABX5J155_9GAMM|nr:hypothetical protein TW86_04610 [Halomonas sp. S2151]MBS8269357.1 hypothetical protein [Halomonas litopenaei]PTL91768.1 hypothetical protein C6W89_06785 [Halomonas sp. SYSU XM8]PTL94806.1 hypothetical protein C6W88_10650 [Halomonas litopenaei]